MDNNNNKNLQFDENNLLLGYGLTKLFLYDIFYNEEEVIIFGEDRPEDSNVNPPFYDFDKVKSKIDSIYNPNDSPHKCCCKCSQIKNFKRENEELKKLLSELYDISTSLNDTVQILNNIWNSAYEDLLGTLSPIIYYLLSQYTLSIPSPSEGIDISLGGINIPTPNIDISTPNVDIPTVDDIKKKARKLDPKLKDINSPDDIGRIIVNSLNLPHDEYDIIFKNKRPNDDAPIKTLIMVANNVGTIGHNNTCKNTYSSIEERILAEIEFAENIWQHVFKLDYEIEYLDYPLNTGEWFEEIVELPNGDIEYKLEQDTLQRIKRNTFDYISNKIDEGVLPDIDLVIVYVGKTGLYEDDLGLTNTLGYCTSYKRANKKDFSIIIISDASISYKSILAHEIGHSLYFSSPNGDSTDPDPMPNNLAHNKNNNNLMYPFSNCDSIKSIVSDTQVLKIGKSTLFKD